MKEIIGKRYKDKTLSEDHKKKISKATSGENNPMFGKHLSEEHKKKLSEILMGKFGKDALGWNPNLTYEERQHTRHYPEYYEWRKAIFKRDNYTCQVCKQYGGGLVAHHLEDYSNNKELRTVLSNGIIMCIKCHYAFHKQYGYDCNRKQYEEFIKGGE